jgi:multidrug resistance efflux pump
VKAESLPRIPIPPEQHWRNFREKVFPGVAFAGVLAFAVWLWGVNLASPLIMGQAEAPEAEVVSTMSGQVVRLETALYREVRAGDVLAVVATSTPEVFSNTLAVIRAEMEAIQAGDGLEPGDRVRVAQLELNWLTLRGELAALRAELEFARAELERAEQLGNTNVIATNIIAQFELEIARRDARRAEVEIAEKGKAVKAAELALSKLNPDASGSSGWQRTSLRVAAEKLRLAESELKPNVLRAPISGWITKLAVSEQTMVVRGQSLATISDPRVNRIVGYIPQPVRVEPQLGMGVEIRTRVRPCVSALHSGPDWPSH